MSYQLRLHIAKAYRRELQFPFQNKINSIQNIFQNAQMV